MEKQYAAHKARENEHRQQQIIAGKKQSIFIKPHFKNSVDEFVVMV